MELSLLARGAEENWPSPGAADGIHELIATIHVIAVDQNHSWRHTRDCVVHRFVGRRENGFEPLYLGHQSKQRADDFLAGEN